jgi:hypothetical protein
MSQKMIDILVDDKKYSFSRKTLDKSPLFIITQILNNLLSVEDFHYIDRISETTFRIDVDPIDFEKKAREIRLKVFVVLELNEPKVVLESRPDNGIISEMIRDLEPKDIVNQTSIFQNSVSSDFDALNLLRTDKIPADRPVDGIGIWRKNIQTSSNGFESDTLNLNLINGLTSEVQADHELDKADIKDFVQNIKQEESTVNTLNQSTNIEKIPKSHHVFRSRKIELNTSENDKK